MKKVIFLDFDGVLNTGKYQAQLKEMGVKGADEFGLLFDPEAVENLKMIIDAVPSALIVINSTWKFEGLDWMKTLWRKRGMPGAVHSVTPYYQFDFAQMDPDELSTAMTAQKGFDIKQWVKDYAPKGCAYVILDDDKRVFLPEQMERLVLTDDYCGLKVENSKEAIAILTNEA